MGSNPQEYLYQQYLEAGLGVSFKGQGKKWDTKEDVMGVVLAIQACKNLKFLELEGNTLGVEAAKEIGKVLESKPELEIALWKDLFTGRLKNEIPMALQRLFAGVNLAGARLQRLDLSDNAIGPVGMAGLAPFFVTPSSFSIQELIVNNQGLGPEGGSTFAQALMTCYEMSCAAGDHFQPKVFVCGRNRQENKGATKWAKFFSTVGSLEEVHMPQNGINPPGVKALSEAFKKNPNLRVINLEDNTVRPDGALMLSETLPTLNFLEELNLGDCLLKSAGARHILDSVRALTTLQTVNLASNEILKQAGIHVASILRTLPNLRTVNLSENEFGVAGVEQITRLLPNIDVTVEDDAGEGDEEEEEDGSEAENANESREYTEDVSSAEEGELSYEERGSELKTSGLDTSLTEPPPVVAVAVVEPNTPPEWVLDQDVVVFMRRPTLENYLKFQPPAQRLVDGLKKNYLENNNGSVRFQEACIWAAITVSQLKGVETQSVFDALLMASLRSTTTNDFVTTLLTTMDFMKPENDKALRANVTDAALNSLSEFLANQPVPVVVFQCIRFFMSTALPKQYRQFNLANLNLLQVIEDRLGVCNL